MFFNIYEYYKKLNNESSPNLPLKSSIKPQEISSVLPWFVILEEDESQKLIVRLAGTNIDRTLGTPLSKTNLLDKYQEEEWEDILSFFGKIREIKCGGYFLQTMTGSNGQDYLNHYMLFPFLDKSGEIKYWAGILDFEPFNRAIIRLDNTFKPGSLEMSAIDVGFGVPEGVVEFDKALFDV